MAIGCVRVEPDSADGVSLYNSEAIATVAALAKRGARSWKRAASWLIGAEESVGVVTRTSPEAALHADERTDSARRGESAAERFFPARV